MDALADRVRGGLYEPLLLMEEDRPRDFSFMPVRQYGKALKTETYPDFSSLLDTFYTRREKDRGLRRRAGNFAGLSRPRTAAFSARSTRRSGS